MGHLRRRIWWWHSFLNLTQGKVNFRSKEVKLGLISNFKIFLQSNPMLCRYVSGFQKSHLFLCATIRNAIYCILIMWRHHLYSFFCPFHSQKQIYCFEILYACMYLSHIFRFFDNLKISAFIGNYFWKIEILNFGGQNRKISKIRDSHFVERSILRRLAFFDCVLLQNWTF